MTAHERLAAWLDQHPAEVRAFIIHSAAGDFERARNHARDMEDVRDNALAFPE